MKLITYFSPLSTKTYAWLLVSKLTTIHVKTSLPLKWEVIFFTLLRFFFLIEPRWFFIRGGEWRKPILCTVRIPTKRAISNWRKQKPIKPNKAVESDGANDYSASFSDDGGNLQSPMNTPFLGGNFLFCEWQKPFVWIHAIVLLLS